MLLNLNTIDDFILSLELLFLVLIITVIITIILFVLRYYGRLEFEISPVKLQINQLVDQLARHFSVALPQIFQLYVIDIW